ncbi:hypothetical protein ACHAXN_009668 [Cyclotella atomus]
MALRGDHEIDALLSIMGGGDSAAAPSASDPEISDFSKAPKKSKTKKSKKSSRCDPHMKSNTHSFVESRLYQNCFRWPQSKNGRRLLLLGTGLADECKGYTAHTEVGSYGTAHCSQCGKVSSTHELCISIEGEKYKDNEHMPYIIMASVFVAARNARCLLGEYYAPKTSASKDNKTLLPPTNSTQGMASLIARKLELFQGRVLTEMRKLESRNATFGIPSSNDLRSMKEKAQSMVKAVSAYISAIAASKSDIDLTNRRLEAISSCDLLYYRCYYTCITIWNNASNAGKKVDLVPLIPHPPTYFSCAGLAWDVLEAGSKALAVFLGTSSQSAADGMHDNECAAPIDESTKIMLMDNWGLKARLATQDSAAGNDNVLLCLWQSRFIETIRHVWATGYSRAVSVDILGVGSFETLHKEMKESDVTELPHNETVAISQSVSIWRDAIRDYPANFYAYACPTKSSIELITSHVKNASGIEAGAGTGYWSALVNSKTKLVIPYDIAPPSQTTPNSYHGEIPSFTDVKALNSFDKIETKSFHDSAPVLLLCYPPPGSDMAFAALSTHLQQGGNTIIHLGEWKGLTGNSMFEDALTDNFDCVEHQLLPLWGTDATYLTIWKRKSNNKSTEQELHSSAFGYCSSQKCTNAAERRCRFARCLQYCSQSCFDKHASERKAYLALHMVHISSEEDLEFDCDRHFVDLQTEEVATERPKKKRKKPNKKR